MLQSISQVDPQFLGEIRSWLEQNPPAISISNILGYSQFVAATQVAEVATAEATTSGTYGDLATPGPTIDGLPGGQYIVLFTCWVAGDAPTVIGPSTLRTFPFASVKYGDAEAVDADAVTASAQGNGAYVSATGFKVVTLPATTNTVTMRYRTGGANPVVVGSQFQHRRLAVLRYATL